jgi:phosphoribosylformylglycinamidine synthase
MIHRIEISLLEEWPDPRGNSVWGQAKNYFGIETGEIRTSNIYTVDGRISKKEAEKIAAEIANPVTDKYSVDKTSGGAKAAWLVRVGLRPGVTDNLGKTAKEAFGDVIGRKLDENENVFSSVEYLFKSPKLKKEEIKKIASGLLANQLIESISIFSAGEIASSGAIHNLPYMHLTPAIKINTYNLEISDDALMEISRKGLLALSIEEMKAIQKYFRKTKGRAKYGLSKNPTDVELEVLAQTWSEHCKHKIFNAEIEYEDEKGGKEKIVSCFKTFICKSTEEISKKVDWLVSVFHDNAGVISLNSQKDLVYKVETHNSPSALDPYGGALTGIVGVNRDPMGTGQGADLLTNVWGYCLASPFTPAEKIPEGLLHPRRLRDGVHKGVIDGGNQSGIPYSLGWEYFDETYTGKPLVFCGTLGTLPKKIGARKGFQKAIKNGDLIVMAGGRIGKDGIHGATFSSEELHTDSPSQAVQIGDPITQKKLSDFILEAREKQLYRFITDNGAGGLSSSIGEMASICGGCEMDLSKAPLKYAGLAPWEILLSEAQERMSFAVPPAKIAEFEHLASLRGVETAVLGKFTDSGKFHIKFGKNTVALLDLSFMHEGLPKMELHAKWMPPKFPEPSFSSRNLKDDIIKMMGRLNICSNEYKARQYDHEVKGLSVIKPFVGKCRDVNSDAAVMMTAPFSREGVILSCAALPRYSLIDCYDMTASVIDLAIRRIIAVGGKPGRIAGLDNFCWPDPVKSDKNPDGEYKLAQLVRANKALYDYTKAFGVPCISGKDSMKNDSVRGGKKISILPTLLFSAVSPMEDISKALTLDAKFVGDLVCVVGITKPELGASEYFSMLGGVGNNVPKVDINSAKKTYSAVSSLTDKSFLHSLHATAIGGLAAAFAKIAIAGRLGLEIDLDKIPRENISNYHELLFSESSGRFLMTISEEKLKKAERIFSKIPFAVVGRVCREKSILFTGAKFKGGGKIQIPIKILTDAYKEPLNGV